MCKVNEKKLKKAVNKIGLNTRNITEVVKHLVGEDICDCEKVDDAEVTKTKTRKEVRTTSDTKMEVME